jgi:phosphoribosylformylglycinamidine synthase II/phosphoribosylformylglycinamidine synthase I
VTNQTYRISVTTRSESTSLKPSKLYFLRGGLSLSDIEQLAQTLLVDPVTETFCIEANPDHTNTLEVSFLAGVTDSVAENLLKAAHHLGFETLEQVATGFRYETVGLKDASALEKLALSLANPVIQQFAINQAVQPPFFDQTTHWKPVIETIHLQNATDEQLRHISRERRLALDLAEMQAIRNYYQKEQREPTDIELEMLAQTWSEHCVHKTFKAEITTQRGETVKGLLKSHLAAATYKLNKPWVRSAFIDNAGIIEFDDEFDLAFKVETHNHPSALEPFGGANTGVGGVIRDLLAVGAKPIANTDVLCFGPLDLEKAPEGVLHPKRIHDGVIKGIEDYGNKMGIPTVSGAIIFHKGYTSNPLVYCGCLGILPASKKNAKPSKAKPGDLIVAVGGRTGRDGLRGATFSSLELDTATSDIASSSVQIGNPITEKQVQEVLLQARDKKLYRAMTDCGAGGFSSAVGEMAQGLGAQVKLENIKTKYAGLHPWELWLSEAQERMVLAVPKKNLKPLEKLCQGQDVELTVLGTFTDTGRLELHYLDKRVGELELEFLHHGLPRKQLTANIPHPNNNQALDKAKQLDTHTDNLLRLLKHPNIRSKESVIRVYDHEIKGGTVVRPLVGAANHGPSDASVLLPNPKHARGVVLSNGICPQFGERDPYAMSFAAIDEAMRNAVAVGADPDHIAILDNFCWGNPNLPDRLGSLLETSRGCHDAALLYETPFVSGKDSLYNEYTDEHGQKHAIPGTLLISAVGIVPDIQKTVTMDFKQAGNLIFVLGDTKDELGQSHFALEYDLKGGRVPQPTKEPLERFRKLYAAIQHGWIKACHDCSEGGLAVALSEMSIAGRCGASVNLYPLSNTLSIQALLFSETLSRFILEVSVEHKDLLISHFANTPFTEIGTITNDHAFTIFYGVDDIIKTNIQILETFWRGSIAPTVPLTRRGERPLITTFHKSGTKRVAILHANGTNRDHDVALAIERAGGIPEIIHMNQLSKKKLDDYHMLVVPGGFSYGDDLGAGVLWALDLREHFKKKLGDFVASGRPVIGICNGFQALVKAGFLLSDKQRRSTLTFNQQGHFECRWVMLEANPNSNSLFTKGLSEPIYCPVAHGEGRFLADEGTLEGLQNKNLIALSYVGDGYPFNPNGSALNIAGICNEQGNVLGLMPHPENHIFPWQHPRFHRGEHGMNGLALFQNGLRQA